MTKIPENSDQTEPPESLRVESGECYHCGAEFESYQALYDHVAECDEK